MCHLKIERHLLGYIERICSEKVRGVYTHVCPEVVYPYALLETRDLKISLESGFASVNFCLIFVSRYQGSQEITALVEHTRARMEMPRQEEGCFRLEKQETKQGQDNLTHQIMLYWKGVVPLSQTQI